MPAALIGESLPVTGLIVRLGKKKKSKKKTAVPQMAGVSKAPVAEPAV